jgi:phospholipid/cholesterol/gamma-HCH transport system ATP-binding protein
VSTRMEDLVRELQRVCPTCILVTHCFSTVRRAADRLVFLHDGRIRWDGTVADIDSCQNPYVRQFFNASLDGPMRFMDDHIAEHERAPQVVLETDLF